MRLLVETAVGYGRATLEGWMIGQTNQEYRVSQLQAGALKMLPSGRKMTGMTAVGHVLEVSADVELSYLRCFVSSYEPRSPACHSELGCLVES